MQFDTHKQFFANESLIASCGGNFTMLREEKEDEEEYGICPECKEEVPVLELKSDDCCNDCFRKKYLQGA